ncbi:MAG: TRAP transporter substrate-binding protein DctP [Treponema sp.]|jgi:TRAP-type C4-dicarboxylate transport system substrate-binding protein|nr:TRAP transporter substrate-binding protein DctP [Treponema sp.]
MKKIIAFIGCLLLVTLVNPSGIFAQRKVTIKLASMAPENTVWGAALNRISREWAAVSNGEVELRVYHNGVAGTETDVLQKLKINQIQAAVLTSFGINLISPEVMTLSTPFFIRDDNELKTVLNAIKPELEAKINAKGFQTLTWVKSGWVKLFSKSPVFVPSDLKRLKVGTTPDAPELTQAFKTMGYQMIPINGSDTLIALNSNRIEALYQSPVMVGGLQLFGVAKHMTSLNVAPFMAGIFLNERAWRMIPEQYRAEIARRSNRIAEEIDASITQLEAEAVQTMKRHGLVVNQVSPEQSQIWYSDMERAIDSLLGTVFDRDTYKKVQLILTDYRSKR